LGTIRAILALSVVVCHLWGHALPFTANGYNAVILFFIISGFYMSMVINNKYCKEPLFNFYMARALRIYPIYLVTLIFIVGFLSATGNPLPAPTATREWIFSTFTNISIFPIPWLGNWDWLAITPAWSLAVELQFYLVAPFIVTRRLWICIAITLGLVALRLSALDQDFAYARYSVPHADWCFFMLGAVAHRLGLLVKGDHVRKAIGWMAVIILPLAGLLCGLPIVKDLDRVELWGFYLVFAAAIPFVFSISMRSRIDRILGELSYPIYIVHWPAIKVILYYNAVIYRFLPYDYYREIDLGLVILASVALHFLIENPVERFRRRFSAPPATKAETYAGAEFKGVGAGAPAE